MSAFPDKISDESGQSDVFSLPDEMPKPTRKGGSYFAGSFNLANAALGAGLLGFPKAFALVGIPFAVVLQVASFTMQYFGILVLGYAANFTSSDSMTLVTRRLLGKWWAQGAVWTLIFYSFTICVYYIQVIQQQAVILGSYLETTQFTKDQFADVFTFVASVLIIYPVSCWQNMSALGGVSFLAFIGCVYVTIYVFVHSVDDAYPRGEATDGNCPEGKGLEKAFPNLSVWSLFEAVPNICFGYASHVPSVPVYADLAPKAQASYHYVAFAGCFLAFVTYTVVGLSGAITFKGCAAEHAIILANYDPSDIAANVGRACIAGAVASSYPLFAFTGRQELGIILEGFVMKYEWAFSFPGGFLLNTQRRRLFVIGSLWFAITLAVALGVSQVKYVINLVGLACAVTMFLFPGAIAMKLAKFSYEGTVDEVMDNLPDGASEKSPDSWAYGARGRVVRWLGKNESRAIWWCGCLFIVITTILLVMCPTTYIRDIINEMS